MMESAIGAGAVSDPASPSLTGVEPNDTLFDSPSRTDHHSLQSDYQRRPDQGRKDNWNADKDSAKPPGNRWKAPVQNHR